MAEKGFGVKDINLIGPSGTPTITSPNNLNLNANNVAISTNVSIGGTLSVTGNVSVGGTLTYEDVTNIDSVGVITARSGVDVDDFISVGSNIHLGNAGIVTATSFSGSGANLTNLPADTPTDSDIQVAYTVTANGSSAYRFAGNGVVSTADDPDLYLIRGQKYRFINNSGGSHPFQIRVSSGGSAYSTGVTNNGAASGNIDFAPTFDSPAQLVYQCTSHSGMVGNIYISDGKYDTKAAHPSFMAYGNSSYTTVTVGSPLNPYVFPNTAHNIGSHYNTSNGKFTCPVDGVYHFDIHMFCDSTTNQTSAATIEFYVRKNGSNINRLHTKKGYGNMGDDQGTVSISFTEQFSANDEITVFTASYVVNYRIYGGHSYFSGYLVG